MRCSIYSSSICIIDSQNLNFNLMLINLYRVINELNRDKYSNFFILLQLNGYKFLELIGL